MGLRRGWIVRASLLLCSALLVGCDHATKVLAQQALGGGRVVELVGGVLDLRYAENHDTAFSLLRNVAIPHKPEVPGAVSLVILLGTLVVAWKRRRAPWPETLAYALVAAGALGNMGDRLARGFVIDFIHIAHWPVFNVADVLIVAGALLLMACGARAHASPA